MELLRVQFEVKAALVVKMSSSNTDAAMLYRWPRPAANASHLAEAVAEN